MSLIITDLETEEQVAEIADDGTIDAQDPMVEEDIDMMLERDRAAPFRYATRVPSPEGDEPIIEEQSMLVQPGEKGYLVAVMENLTYPYAVDKEETDGGQLENPERPEETATQNEVEDDS